MWQLLELFVVVVLAGCMFGLGLWFIFEAISGFWFEASRAIKRWRRGGL